MSNDSFDAKLKTWIEAHDGQVKLLRELTGIAIKQLVDNFQMSNLQKLNDALAARKNTTRHNVFCEWLATFFPLKMEKGLLKKDGKRALELSWESNKSTIVANALKEPYWDWKPTPVVTEFNTPAQMIAEVEKAIVAKFKRASFEGSGEMQVSMVNLLKQHANDFHVEPAKSAAQ